MVFRHPKEDKSTGETWRGLSIGVRDEGVGVDAPTQRGEKPFILQKVESLPANLFLEILCLPQEWLKFKILRFETKSAPP